MLSEIEMIHMKPHMLIVVCLSVLLLMLFSGCTSNNTNNTSSDEDDNISNNSSWLDTYSPTHKEGEGINDFWVTFPTINPKANQSVKHLSWIIDDLEEKPIVFVCHRTGCTACTPQADRIKAFRDIYAEDAIFYDLDDPYEGYGTSTGDILLKYNQAFYYDPNGPPSYIALTGVFTLIEKDGKAQIGWHTWEGNVADTAMENWIKDAIYYYHVNSEDT